MWLKIDSLNVLSRSQKRFSLTSLCWAAPIKNVRCDTSSDAWDVNRTIWSRSLIKDTVSGKHKSDIPKPKQVSYGDIRIYPRLPRMLRFFVNNHWFLFVPNDWYFGYILAYLWMSIREYSTHKTGFTVELYRGYGRELHRMHWLLWIRWG